MKATIIQLHKLLKDRQSEVKTENIGAQAIFAMRLAHYKNAYDGLFPIDYCAEEWRESTGDTEKQIYKLLKKICDMMPAPEPRRLGRIGCVTCGSIPEDAKIRGMIE